MDSLLYLAFLVLEERSVFSPEAATKLYELCCEILGLIPSPLMPEENTP